MNNDTDSRDATLVRLEEASRRLLRERAEALPGALQSRLTAARHAALAEHARAAGTRRFRVPGMWLPGGALAAAAVLALAVFIARPVSGPGNMVAEASPVEDAEMLAAKDEPELYADDPDFYEWAGSVQAAGAG